MGLGRAAAWLYKPAYHQDQVKLDPHFLCGLPEISIKLRCLKMVLDVEDTAYLLHNAVSISPGQAGGGEVEKLISFILALGRT